MNRADASRIGAALEERGYAPTRQPREADILLLNTCVVRQSAEDKVLGRLNSLRPLKDGDKDRALLVMGCFVDDIPALHARYPFVDAFFKPSDISGVLAFIDERNDEHVRCMGLASDVCTPPQVADMVPISYGCDHHCTYCIVRLRRGPQRSRAIDEIVAEAKDLVRRGAREITLLGQNVDAYGTDLSGGADLADVLFAVHEIEGLRRIRFLTSHPTDMTQRIIETVAALPKVCPCWELAVQSGDDDVLRRMGRDYAISHFRDLVRRIREATPDCAINTDVIVGFSGETAEQFEHTRQLVEETRFDLVHVAAYSVRDGTPAARWKDDVSPAEKERRRLVIEGLQTEIADEINAAFLGRELEILVDGRQRGRWRGRTRTNKLVFFESDGDWLGRMARVRIRWTGPWSMLGEIASPGQP